MHHAHWESTGPGQGPGWVALLPPLVNSLSLSLSHMVQLRFHAFSLSASGLQRDLFQPQIVLKINLHFTGTSKFTLQTGPFEDTLYCGKGRVDSQFRMASI